MFCSISGIVSAHFVKCLSHLANYYFLQLAGLSGGGTSTSSIKIE